MSKTLVVNISGSPAYAPKYNKTVLPGPQNGLIVNDTVANVITNLGGAAAIKGLWDCSDVPDAQTATETSTGGSGLVGDLAAPAGQAAIGSTGRLPDAGHVHPIGTIADAQVAVGTPIVYTRNIADAATADYDVVITEKVEITEVVCQKRAANGGAANTVQLKKGATAVSDAISININDTLLARSASIDDAQSTFNAGDTMRVTVTKAGGNAACYVEIRGIRRA